MIRWWGDNQQTCIGMYLLEVTVSHFLVVHVFDPINNLTNHNGAISFGVTRLLLDSVEEFSAGAVLHDNVEVLLVLESLLGPAGVIIHYSQFVQTMVL